MSWVEDALDALDEPIDQGWWEAQEEADAREEAEHGRPVWNPEWVKLRDRISHGRDPKNLASSNESQEARY